jgi:hypothetical protein
MTERKKRARRRCVFTQAFDHQGSKCIAAVYCYADGRPAELVLKPGSPTDVTGHWDAALVTSIALQFGQPLCGIQAALEYLGAGRAEFGVFISLPLWAESGRWQ